MSLNQLLDQFLGGQATGSQQPAHNNAGGLAGITDKIPGGLAGGLAAGGLLGLLAGNKKIRKKAGKLAGGAVGLGGAAVLGALAFKAYQNWQGGQAPGGGQPTQAPQRGSVPSVQAPATAPQRFDPQANVATDGQPFQIALVKAMIAAANADGHIDSTEQQAIFDAVNKLQLDASDKALVFDTLQNPPSVETIAGFADGLEQASELYMVSRLAIDPDHPAEKAYLQELSRHLSLPDDLVAHLEAQIDAAETTGA